MRFYPAFLLQLALLSCSGPSDSTTDTAAAPSATLQAPSTTADTAAPPAADVAPGPGWPAAFASQAGRTCARVTAQPATLYRRPATDAPRFGQTAAGEKLTLLARTADGWVGFDPSVAQAANVGIFRLRWLPQSALAPGADCADLPLVTAPPAGCLLMASHPVPVRAQPAAGAAVLSTIPTGSYAQVSVADVTGGWLKVTVPGQAQPGYVAEADINFSGECR